MDAPLVLTATVEGGRLTDFDRRSLPVPWWSLTKTAIAAAALALVGDGRLALDEPLDARPYTCASSCSTRRVCRNTGPWLPITRR